MEDWLQRNIRESFIRRRWRQCLFLLMIAAMMAVITELAWDRFTQYLIGKLAANKAPIINWLIVVIGWEPLPIIIIVVIIIAGFLFIWHSSRQYRINQLAYAGLDYRHITKAHPELYKQLEAEAKQIQKGLIQFAEQVIKREWANIGQELQLYNDSVHHSQLRNRNIIQQEKRVAKALKRFAAKLENVAAIFEKATPLLSEAIYGYSNWLASTRNLGEYEYENFVNILRRLHQALGTHFKNVMTDMLRDTVETIRNRDINQEINGLCIAVDAKISRLAETCSFIQKVTRESLEVSKERIESCP